MHLSYLFSCLLVSFLIASPARADLIENLRVTTFVSWPGAPDEHWYSNYLSDIAVVPGGYLAIGGVEVQESEQAMRVLGTTLYAYRLLDTALTTDDSFGSNGKLALSLPPGNTYRSPDLVTLPGGGFLLAAEAQLEGDWEQQRIIVAKFNAAGAPDTTFGDDSDGSVMLTMPCTLWDAPTPAFTAQAPQLLAMSDGRLVVTGSTACDGSRQGFVARLSANGVQETSWGDDGYLLIQPGAVSPTWLTNARLDGSGRLVVAGEVQEQVWIGRITLGATPILDTTFDGDGIRVVDVGAYEGFVSTLAIDGGRVVLGVSRTLFDPEALGNSEPTTAVLVRLLANGTPDAAFGTEGIVTFNPGAAPGSSRVGAILPVGGTHLLVAGAVDERRTVALLNGSGALDTSNAIMGATGYWQTPFSNISGYAAAIIDGEKLLAVGQSRTASGTGSVSPNELTDDSIVVSSFGVGSFGSAGAAGGTGGGSSGGGAFGLPMILLLALGMVWRRTRTDAELR